MTVESPLLKLLMREYKNHTLALSFTLILGVCMGVYPNIYALSIKRMIDYPHLYNITTPIALHLTHALCWRAFTHIKMKSISHIKTFILKSAWLHTIKAQTARPIKDILEITQKMEHLHLYPLLIIVRSMTLGFSTAITLYHLSSLYCYLILIWLCIFVLMSLKNDRNISSYDQKLTVQHQVLDQQLQDYSSDDYHMRFCAHAAYEWDHLHPYCRHYYETKRSRDMHNNNHQTLFHLTTSILMCSLCVHLYFKQPTISYTVLCLTTVIFFTDHIQWIKDQTTFLLSEWRHCHEIFSQIIMSVDRKGQSQLRLPSEFQRLAIWGPTGSGKTTAVKHWLCSQLAQYDPKDILTVCQHDALPHRSVYETLAHHSDICDKTVESALIKIDLHDQISQYPQGIHTHDHHQTLSSGQRQQLLIARAFVTKPKILICDEACSSVDLKKSLRIIAQLKSQLPDTQIIWITHRVEEVYCFEDVIHTSHQALNLEIKKMYS